MIGLCNVATVGVLKYALLKCRCTNGGICEYDNTDIDAQVAPTRYDLTCTLSIYLTCFERMIQCNNVF